MTVEGPDTGYSWVIVFCCAYMHFALFGLFRASGVMYVAIINTYHVTREEASWPFSLCAATFQLIGPAVSIITHYMSKRSACLLGSTIATIGVVGCYFAKDVMSITILYGIVHGLGFGIVVTLIPVMLNLYFVKYKATAIGIAFSGATVSSFLFPIVMEWLLESYGLDGTFLLIGGLVMNTLVVSALLRAPPWLKKKSTKLSEHSNAKDSGLSIADLPNDCKNEIPAIADGPYSKFQDSVFTEASLKKDENNSLVDLSQVSSKDDNTTEVDTLKSNCDSLLFEESEDNFEKTVSDNYKDMKVIKEVGYEVHEPLMNDNDVTVLPKSRETLHINKIKIKCKVYDSILEILRNPMFHLITFTMYIFFLALQSFFIIIVDYAKDKGIPEADGIYIISIFSLTDLLGRSGLGWVTDKNYIKRKNMIILNLTTVGIIMQLYPLIDDFTGLLVVSAFHGISVGSCITLFFVIQAEYLGTKRLTLVIGLTSFINGVLTLSRPFIIGLFRDVIGSYDWMFHLLGMISILFSFIWLTETFIARRKIFSKRTLSVKA